MVWQGCKVVSDTMESVIKAVEARGLAMHETQISCDAVEAFGVVLDPGLRHTRLTNRRFWKIRDAITGALERRRLSGRALEILIGHMTFDREV